MGERDKKEKKGLRSAVAVRYNIEKDKAPFVVAAGQGTIAEEILRVAEDNKIPLYEDKKLVDLLSKIELDTAVPPELYILVAQVLFFVYKLDKMAEKREKLITRLKSTK